MKRKGLSILAMVLIFALMSMPVSATKPDPLPLRVVDTVETSVNPAINYAADLMAGQNTAVGTVYIDAYENDTYEVRYEITETNWYLTEIHFEAINAGDEVFIENKGTLIPGKFTVKKKFELADEVTEYSFKYVSGDDVIEFAAHAVVGQHEVTHDVFHSNTILSDIDTLFYDGSTWVSSILTWTHPGWTSNGDASALTAAGAKWIWESYNAIHPRLGDVVEFRREFSVQGTPTAAILEITADNEYVGDLNGKLVEYSNTTWTNVETYDVSGEIVTGQNFLNIEVENIPWGTDDPEVNPGGLLYKLVVESTETVVDIPEIYESAWGAGEDAGTFNWSMVIPIEDIVEGYYRWVEYEVLSVPGTSTAITESITLSDAVEYKVEASGTYKFANWTDAGIADAVYSLRIVPYIPAGYPAGSPQWVDGADLSTPHEFWLQLWIDSANVPWVGTYTDNIYTYELIGDGTSLEFTILDTSYGDNSGALTVIIYEWTWGW